MKPCAIPRRWEAVAVVLITLLAALLRFSRLPGLPPGLHFDEGFKAVTARSLLEGAPPQIFFESDMGEEPIALYLLAAVFGLLGQAPWLVRLPSAIVGTLTMPLVWWLSRELFQQPGAQPSAAPDLHSEPAAALPGQLVSLGAATILGILYWHLSFSRIGMEPILVPFFAALSFAALARGLNTGRRLPYVLAGLGLGGSLYTYKAGYFVPLLAALFVAAAAAINRRFLALHGRRLALAAAVAAIVAAPIGLYFATHPANLIQRPASVSLVGGEQPAGSPWRALADNVPQVAGLFFVRGDSNPRSNLPGRPALDPFLALLFLAGIARAVAGFARRQWPAALLLVWLVVMALPTLLTADAPHFGRAIGLTPAIALLCAWGGCAIWQGARRFRRRWIRIGAALLVAAGLVFSAASTVHGYFRTWGRSPDLFYAYDVGLVEVAQYVNSVPATQDVAITPTSQEHYTLQFLGQRPLASFDGRAGLVFPPPGRESTVIVLLREDRATLPALEEARPDGRVVWTMVDGFGRPYAAAYHLPAAEDSALAPAPDRTVDAILGGAARLMGYSLDAKVASPGDTVYLTLYWQALAPLAEDYTVFTHLLGAPNPATGSLLWAGHDGRPDGGHYPTSAWQPGQIILDVHPLTLPLETPPGDYQIEAGLYLLATMGRVPAADSAGRPLPEGAVRLGALRVE